MVRRLVAALSLAGSCMASPAPDPQPTAADPVPLVIAPHFADGRFFNPPPFDIQKSTWDFLRWRLDRLLGRRAGDGDGRPAERVPNDGSELRLADGLDRLCWIGHSTVFLRIDGVAILMDPIWGDLLIRERAVPPGVALEDLPAVDTILVTHSHYDHLDADTIDGFDDGPTFLVPLGLEGLFRERGNTKVHALDWGEAREVRGVRFTFVPARHWSRRGLHDANESLWGGWVVEGAGHAVYYSGDSGYFSGFGAIGKRFPGIDVAIFPVGAYEPRWFMSPSHMGPEETGQAFLDVGARVLLPVHWGTFVLGDEPLDEPPEKMRQWWAARGSGDGDNRELWILKVGETRVIP